ncbi:hypothetical protein EBU71_18870 [bacterium]|nr:hypothetical protein [Candidatus Elulimicrobium humile]
MIYTIDDFLDAEDLTKYKMYVNASGLSQNIKQDNALTTEFWSKYGEKINASIPSLHFTGLYPHVTITNSSKPVIRHLDNKVQNETHKLLIYLNHIERGGTIFFMDDKNTEQLVKNKENRAVIFDINLYHESQKFEVSSQKKKMAIGFRMKSQSI